MYSSNLEKFRELTNQIVVWKCPLVFGNGLGNGLRNSLGNLLKNCSGNYLGNCSGKDAVSSINALKHYRKALCKLPLYEFMFSQLVNLPFYVQFDKLAKFI